MDYANPLLVIARRYAGATGMLRPLQRAVRAVLHSSYEGRFHDLLLGAPQPGDTVWDIGAYVGQYTKGFAERVGPTGKVIAFEPVPASASQIVEKCHGLPVTIHEVALSDVEGHAKMAVDRPDQSANRLDDKGNIDVRLAPGDLYLEGGAPDVIKIDVEGHELAVLQGLEKALGTVREVFIEVHFQALTRLGYANGPRAVELMLKQAGLNTRWVDSSHLHGFKA